MLERFPQLSHRGKQVFVLIILCWWRSNHVTKNNKTKLHLHSSFALQGKVDRKKEKDTQIMVFGWDIE